MNFFRAHFLLKCHPNLHKYYKLNCRNKTNFKIRHCLISGGCLIDQAHARSKSGGRLIYQAAAWSKLGNCLIDHARSKSGSSLIDQALPDQNQVSAWLIWHMPEKNQVAAWSIRLLPDQNQAAAWSIRTLVCEKSTLNPYPHLAILIIFFLYFYL